jgi:ribosome-binding protein aMBF1 (putative translation factor)
MQTIQKNGRTYALVPIETWRKLSARKSAGTKAAASAAALPALPEADAQGNVDAIAYARASIARSLIEERQAAGLSQAELARRAAMDPATLNRIERAKVTLDEATYRRLQKAMKR